MGVTDEEIHAIPRALAANVGAIEAYRAAKAIAEVNGEPFSEGKPVEHMIFPQGEPNTAYARYFIGNSYLAPLLTEGLPMSNVTFEPRCGISPPGFPAAIRAPPRCSQPPPNHLPTTPPQSQEPNRA